MKWHRVRFTQMQLVELVEIVKTEDDVVEGVGK